VESSTTIQLIQRSGLVAPSRGCVLGTACRAARDGDRKRILIMIPLMWECRVYPLRGIHTRLVRLGRSVHFQILDLLLEGERREVPGNTE
jgi:hypothetical protein